MSALCQGLLRPTPEGCKHQKNYVPEMAQRACSIWVVSIRTRLSCRHGGFSVPGNRARGPDSITNLLLNTQGLTDQRVMDVIHLQAGGCLTCPGPRAFTRGSPPPLQELRGSCCDLVPADLSHYLERWMACFETPVSHYRNHKLIPQQN